MYMQWATIERIIVRPIVYSIRVQITLSTEHNYAQSGCAKSDDDAHAARTATCLSVHLSLSISPSVWQICAYNCNAIA